MREIKKEEEALDNLNRKLPLRAARPVSPILRQIGACPESLAWIAANPRPTFVDLWQSCPRGDWLLWLAARAGVDRRTIVLAVCDCAETALVHVPAGEDRPRLAIDTARRWARGEASSGDARKAANDAADAAYAAARAAAAADAAYAADAATAAADAAYAAARAADAAARAAADAAAAAARADADAAHRSALARCADLVRARIDGREVERLLAAMGEGVA